MRPSPLESSVCGIEQTIYFLRTMEKNQTREVFTKRQSSIQQFSLGTQVPLPVGKFRNPDQTITIGWKVNRLII